ncbi:MAG: cyclase family protein [Planctomycetaceae bacterium]|nr:cyclase family protein [Planctomycetaceae bacterium]
MRYSEVFDITAAMRPGMPVWPGDKGFVFQWCGRIEQGAIANSSRLTLGVHTGTHLDAPNHFIDKGDNLDAFGPERFVLEACLVDCGNVQVVTAEHVAAADAAAGEAVIFKTANTARRLLDKQEFTKDYAYVSGEAARACVDRGFSLVGVDYLSTDMFEAPGYPAHMAMLGTGIILLEGLVLNDVPPGRYTLIALPLKIRGAEASPVRAVLLR